MRSVGVAHYVEQVQYVEPQEEHISPASYLHNRSTSDMSTFVYRCNLTEGTFFRSMADPSWYTRYNFGARMCTVRTGEWAGQMARIQETRSAQIMGFCVPRLIENWEGVYRSRSDLCIFYVTVVTDG